MHNLNILIIEDESILALGLSMKLQNLGCNVVDYVTNIEDAKRVICKNDNINLLLLDINLNDLQDGIEFYSELKIDIPLIYITAYSDEKTITRAVLTNPMGYLTKPVNEKELFALTKIASLRLLKKSPQKLSSVTVIDKDYSYDTQHNILYCKNEQIPIYGKMALLLHMLVVANGKYIPFSILEEEIYRDAVPSSSSLRTLVYRLRLKFENDMFDTKRGCGVRIKFNSR